VDIAFDCRAVTLDVIVELFYETYGVGIAREWNGDNDTSDAKSPQFVFRSEVTLDLVGHVRKIADVVVFCPQSAELCQNVIC